MTALTAPALEHHLLGRIVPADLAGTGVNAALGTWKSTLQLWSGLVSLLDQKCSGQGSSADPPPAVLDACRQLLHQLTERGTVESSLKAAELVLLARDVDLLTPDELHSLLKHCSDAVADADSPSHGIACSFFAHALARSQQPKRVSQVDQTLDESRAAVQAYVVKESGVWEELLLWALEGQEPHEAYADPACFTMLLDPLSDKHLITHTLSQGAAKADLGQVLNHSIDCKDSKAVASMLALAHSCAKLMVVSGGVHRIVSTFEALARAGREEQAQRLSRIVALLLHNLARRGILASLLRAPEAMFRLRAAQLLVAIDADPAFFRFCLSPEDRAALQEEGLPAKLCPLIASHGAAIHHTLRACCSALTCQGQQQQQMQQVDKLLLLRLLLNLQGVLQLSNLIMNGSEAGAGIGAAGTEPASSSEEAVLPAACSSGAGVSSGLSGPKRPLLGLGLMDSELMSDVRLEMAAAGGRPSRTWRTHRLAWLGVGSARLAEQLQEEARAEDGKDARGPVWELQVPSKVPGLTAEDVAVALRWLYTDVLSPAGADVQRVLQLARAWQVPGLRLACERRLLAEQADMISSATAGPSKQGSTALEDLLQLHQFAIQHGAAVLRDGTALLAVDLQQQAAVTLTPADMDQVCAMLAACLADSEGPLNSLLQQLPRLAGQLGEDDAGAAGGLPGHEEGEQHSGSSRLGTPGEMGCQFGLSAVPEEGEEEDGEEGEEE